MDWCQRHKLNQAHSRRLMDWLISNWLVLLFSIPIIHILFLSSFDGEFSGWQFAARLFFLPTLFFEIGIFILAVACGLNLSKSLADLSAPARIFLFGWLGVLAASLFYADAVLGLAIRGMLFWVIHILFCAAAVHLMSLNRSYLAHPRPFLLAMPFAASAAGLAILAFVYWTGLDSDFNWNEDLPGFSNLRHTGYIFAPAIALGLGHLAAWPQKSPRMHMILLFINTTMMLWLGSRGPVLGIIFGFVLCMMFFPVMRRLLFWFRSAAAIGLGALASVILPIPNNPHFGAIQRFWVKGLDNQTTSGRTDMWLESLELISKKPLFGYGAHQYQFIAERAMGMYKHPHQNILQFLFDWGWVGGGLFLCLLAMLAFKAFFVSQCSTSTKLVSAMVVATLLGFSFVDGVYFYPLTIAITAVFLIWPIVEGDRIKRNNIRVD